MISLSPATLTSCLLLCLVSGAANIALLVYPSRKQFRVAIVLQQATAACFVFESVFTLTLVASELASIGSRLCILYDWLSVVCLIVSSMSVWVCAVFVSSLLQGIHRWGLYDAKLCEKSEVEQYYAVPITSQIGAHASTEPSPNRVRHPMITLWLCVIYPCVTMLMIVFLYVKTMCMNRAKLKATDIRLTPIAATRGRRRKRQPLQIHVPGDQQQKLSVCRSVTLLFVSLVCCVPSLFITLQVGLHTRFATIVIAQQASSLLFAICVLFWSSEKPPNYLWNPEPSFERNSPRISFICDHRQLQQSNYVTAVAGVPVRDLSPVSPSCRVRLDPATIMGSSVAGPSNGYITSVDRNKNPSPSPRFTSIVPMDKQKHATPEADDRETSVQIPPTAATTTAANGNVRRPSTKLQKFPNAWLDKEQGRRESSDVSRGNTDGDVTSIGSAHLNADTVTYVKGSRHHSGNSASNSLPNDSTSIHHYDSSPSLHNQGSTTGGGGETSVSEGKTTPASAVPSLYLKRQNTSGSKIGCSDRDSIRERLGRYQVRNSEVTHPLTPAEPMSLSERKNINLSLSQLDNSGTSSTLAVPNGSETNSQRLAVVSPTCYTVRPIVKQENSLES